MSDNLSVRFVRAKRFRQMAAAVGRLQRLLRSLGPDRAAARDHRDDLAALLRRLRAGATAWSPKVAANCSGSRIICFHRSTTLIEPLCYLQDLFTVEAARGKGVGRALIEGVYAAGETAGLAARLLADARDQPHRAHALRQGRRASGISSSIASSFELVLTPRTRAAACKRARISTGLWINMPVTAHVTKRG